MNSPHNAIAAILAIADSFFSRPAIEGLFTPTFS